VAKSNGIKVKNHIKEAGASLKDLMQEHLTIISEDMIDQVRINLNKATPAQRVNAYNGVTPTGAQAYQSELLTALSIISFDAIDQARREVPKAKKVKLSDLKKYGEIPEESINLSEFDLLPPGVQRALKNQARFLVGTQLADLEKNLFFQFSNSYDSTDSIDTILDDLAGQADDYMEGVAIESGAVSVAGKTINDARNAFFFDDDVLEELDGFEFWNGDPVTDICNDLYDNFGPGKYLIAKDDPNLFRLTPPLHWRCKSTILPVLKGKAGDRETKPFAPSESSLEDQIQFSECHHYLNHKLK